MNHKILLFLVFAIIALGMSGCGNSSIYYQNSTIAYPITLNKMIGVPKVSTPQNVYNHGEIVGIVGLSKTSSNSNNGFSSRSHSNLTYSFSPDYFYDKCFQKGTENKKRFCSNLKFELENLSAWGMTRIWMDFKVDCNEINEENAK